MNIPTSSAGARIEHLDALVQVRCELDSSKDSNDVSTPSLGPGIRTWTSLHTLRLYYYSAEDRNTSQKIFNNWSSSFTPEEAKAIDMISSCCNRDHIPKS